MANKSPRSGSSAEVATTSPQDLHPTSDIRFVIHEIGKLTAKVDRLIADVDKHGEKIDAVRHQVTFVKGALWIIGFAIVLIGGIATWLFTGKLSIILTPLVGH
jgi:hypothetical protein